MVINKILLFVIIYLIASFPLANQAYQKLYDDGEIKDDSHWLVAVAILLGCLPYVPLYYFLLLQEFFVYLYITFKRKD